LPTSESHIPTADGRRAAMALLAQGETAEIVDGLAAFAGPLRYVELRPAATGLVMLRGRIGGDGAPFNLGEATVTRAAIRMETGEVGFSYLLGRDPKRARLAAVCDALWQRADSREAVERHVLAPIRTRVERERSEKRSEAAATRVDFFTLVRGEDE
jgi:alpha-D-ribose 1-methylphosphonate 5-triphosphate synthase subunit PhnG